MYWTPVECAVVAALHYLIFEVYVDTRKFVLLIYLSDLLFVCVGVRKFCKA